MTSRPWLVCPGSCGKAARAYMNGPACPEHSPATLAGHTEVIPDPERTLYGYLALDDAGRARVDRDALRLAQRGKRRSSTRKRGRPGERWFTADDVDMPRVHAAEARVGRVLEQQRLDRIAARDGAR